MSFSLLSWHLTHHIIGELTAARHLLAHPLSKSRICQADQCLPNVSSFSANPEQAPEMTLFIRQAALIRGYNQRWTAESPSR